MTSGVMRKWVENSKFNLEVTTAFVKYSEGDWGDTPESDGYMNDLAVVNKDDRIVAKYKTCAGDIFIITEWDRSVTTILFTHEY